MHVVERIEALEEEKQGVADQIKEVYANAKSRGFDPKVVRQVVKDRKMAQEDFEDWQAVLATYRRAVGLLADTPLGEAAIAAASRRRSAPAGTH